MGESDGNAQGEAGVVRRSSLTDEELVGPDGKYRLEKNLNEGHFGKVRLAYDTTTNEDVAIKFIPRGPTISEYVEREILNHRTLCHPHIISFKEVFVTEQHLCIVMEYAAGGDMHEFIAKEKCLPEEFARWFFQQLCIAISYCHKRDVVNRDIKLENILLDESRRLLKVCDFGFSKGKKDSDPKSMVGTPSYLAPEVLRNPMKKLPYNGKQVDIWTCGVCLFVMLYGYYPFDDPYDRSSDRTTKMLKRIVTGQIQIPKHQLRHTGDGLRTPVPISDDCRDLLAHILEPNPLLRMSMDRIMTHSWFQEGLPEGALAYNHCVEQLDESYIESEKGLQSEATIKAIVREAKSGGLD